MLKRFLIGLSAVGFVAAAQAGVRVVHASPDAPNVDVLVNDGQPPAIQNLPFTNATPYINLASADYNFKVVPAGQAGPVVINANVPVNSAQDISVVAANSLASIEPLVLNDDNTIDGANARVRFVHLSPNAPTVDITLAGGGTTLFDNVSFKGNGGYISVPGGVYDLEVRTADGTTVVLPVNDLGLNNGTVYTVFAMGFLSNLQAVVTVDAIPEPGTLSLLALGAFGLLRRR